MAKNAKGHGSERQLTLEERQSRKLARRRAYKRANRDRINAQERVRHANLSVEQRARLKEKGRQDYWNRRRAITLSPEGLAKIRARDLQRVIRRAGRPPPKECEACGKEKRLYFDHDHSTGIFRGWICSKCNLALGHVDDDLETLRGLMTYLERARDGCIK